MSAARSRQVISLDTPSSICASPAPRRSSTTANRRTGNMRSPARRATSAGPTNASSSSTRISAFPVRARRRVRLCSPHRRSGARARGPGAWSRGLAARAQQRRMVSPDRSGRIHRHADRRRRRHLSSGRLQRSPPAGAQRHDERSRTARAARAPQWRNPQQGGTGRTAPRPADRLRLGEADGEVRFHPDEAVVAAIREVFARFAEMGSARRVWLWFRSEGLKFPLQMHARAEIRWVEASYTAVHHVLSNPVYAGAYAYAKRARRQFSTRPARARNAFDACLAQNGRSSSLSITRASSTGGLMKQISNVSRRT